MGMYIKKEILEGETLCIECINGKYVALSEEDGEHYEIVGVPTPHGRLIDAAELKKQIEKMDTKAGCIVALANAPTVIDAEE